ncbi:phenazine biosynthesis protein PhzF [Pseudoalteromonas sp. MSK9-3]|uniref:PhzF family phenazine biosynthesis protein n=1 Tax=Pseudoalteromonas sp. MSK9-3 TaxID=1897633 RepID=UPI000E6BE81B|nr:PhzF family phenazine biosynthesis protein [Pseudoalteromonas sp. MSK9-3]RJE77536.1 phenazine biosynthesis protein PhzF [Pseudoalteromonas sp. MSK9-3]
MKLLVRFIDAFIGYNCKGNSAAVIEVDMPLTKQLMQEVATKNNVSETSFIIQNKNKYEIRWFSPLTEIDFCGHATLASAHYLFEENPELEKVVFITKAVGDITVEKQVDGAILMDFPKQEPNLVTSPPKALITGLTIKPAEVYCNAQAYFAIYNTEHDVHMLEYTTSELIKLAPRDVVVTALSQEYDFVSRYFWPANGGDEDPVTGSIHTGLAPFWARRLNKNALVAYQASERGGILDCLVDNDRVAICGKAATALRSSVTI